MLSRTLLMINVNETKGLVSEMEATGEEGSTTPPATICANLSCNATEPFRARIGYYFYKTEQLAFLSVLFVFIVVSNILILVAILFSKNRKSRMNFFIVHLAIADLSMGLVVVLPDIIWKATVEWHGGTAVCKLLKYLQSTAIFASTYVLVALSIDRVKAIAQPLTPGTNNSRRLLIMVAWLSSLLLSVPMLILTKEKLVNGMVQCQIFLPYPWHWKVYLSSLAILVFIAPAVVIAVCYTIIVVIIWNKGSMTTGTMETKTTINRTTVAKRRRGAALLQYSMRRSFASQPEVLPRFSSRSSSRGVIPKAKIKTIKMTLAIVLVFIFCWSPFFVFDLLDVFGFIGASQRKVAIATFIQSLASLNGAANPIIFCIFSTREWQGTRFQWSRFCRSFNCLSFLRRLPSGGLATRASAFSGATAYTVAGAEPGARGSRRLKGSSGGSNGRRHSATPFVKGSLSEIENEILLKHICGPRNEARDSDITNDSG